MSKLQFLSLRIHFIYFSSSRTISSEDVLLLLLPRHQVCRFLDVSDQSVKFKHISVSDQHTHCTQRCLNPFYISLTVSHRSKLLLLMKVIIYYHVVLLTLDFFNPLDQVYTLKQHLYVYVCRVLKHTL